MTFAERTFSFDAMQVKYAFPVALRALRLAVRQAAEWTYHAIHQQPLKTVHAVTASIV